MDIIAKKVKACNHNKAIKKTKGKVQPRNRLFEEGSKVHETVFKTEGSLIWLVKSRLVTLDFKAEEI